MNLLKTLRIATCFATLLTAQSTMAADRPLNKMEVKTYEPIVAKVNELNAKYGAENVLIVLDIDNTILTSSVDLGGDIWYQWQRGKLDIKPSLEQKVSCLFEDSIGLLYELTPMYLTEENLPNIISSWQQTNTLFALTSRAPKYRPATERELDNKGIDLAKAAIAPVGQKAPLYREMLEREMSYMEGIMMTSGMNKGEMLDYLLSKTGRKFDAFVFVDDSEKNIVDLYNNYKSQNTIDRNIVHYINIEAKREAEFGALITKVQADQMASQWTKLNETLNAIFPQRNTSGKCLSID
ncbi:MAG: DUF2608 domain-containing protein [Thalassotalea sp.]|nr:DUF2608 domain-containing protein [Thalassotalea sp.]